MANIQEVLTCVRVMDYNGVRIHYTSGICKGDVKVSALDCFIAMKQNGVKNLGYVVDVYDLINMLEKSGMINKSIYLTFTEEKIADYLENYYVPVDAMIAVADHYRIVDFRHFLTKAKNQIDDIGCYIGQSASLRTEDKKQNTDLNLSNYLDLDAVGSYADLNNMFPDSVYVEVCDTISEIVFGDRMEDVRYNLNLYSDDYLSDHIRQDEYDEICFLCRVISYLMEFSDISMYGMSIFCHMALRSVKRFDRGMDGIKDYQQPAVKRTEINKPVYDNMGGGSIKSVPDMRDVYQSISSDDKDYSHYEDEYGDDPYYVPIKKNKNAENMAKKLDKEIKNFKKNM